MHHVDVKADLSHHQYADDRAYANLHRCRKKNTESPLLKLALQSIHSWLQHNGLQLYPRKSELIQFIHEMQLEVATKLMTLTLCMFLELLFNLHQQSEA